MTFSFTPFGGGSRVVSLWEMLRFHADKFVEVLNLLNTVETLLAAPKDLLSDPDMLSYFGDEVQRLKGQLLGMNLWLSAKEAERLSFGLTKSNRDKPDAWALYIKRHIEKLRERVADELEGKALYYVSDHVNLLSESPLFGEQVDDAFPSAQYDISEAGRCLALNRSTACVVHLMRALEFGLSSLATALDMNRTNENWNTIIEDIEKEIRSRNKASHGEKWRNNDEPFFSGAAAHFRLIKNVWRNHAAHGRAKYTEEQAEEIYVSVRSFMRHLSERLSEEGQSS